MPAVKHHWEQLPSSVVGGLRLEDAIVKSPAGWIAFGQVRASVRDIFRRIAVRGDRGGALGS